MSEKTPLHDLAAQAGAVFLKEGGYAIPAHFGDPEGEHHQARTGAVLADDSHHGKVEVRGPDAARFLHNLMTNDVLGLAPGRGCETFLTTSKARVIAYLRLYRQAGSGDAPVFWLDVAPGAAGRVVAHLDRYLISEQVEFADRTREVGQIHLAGPQAAALVRDVLRFEPPAAGEWVADARGQVRRHDALGVPGFDILAADVAEFWRMLTAAGARPVGREACEVLRVEAGLPREGADIDENTFAPEVGRTSEAISYTKGCYLGQESIVMARDRGQVNRGLVGVRLPSGPVPKDSALYAGEKQAGRVTSSVRSPRLGIGVGLAYVRRGHQEPGTKLEVEVDGQRSPVEVAKPPF